MYALYSVNGQQDWTFTTPSQLAVASPVLSDALDVLVFGAADTYVYAVGAYNGTLLWKFQTADVVSSKGCIDEARAVVYIGGVDGR